jgi:hypothetical protein
VPKVVRLSAHTLPSFSSLSSTGVGNTNTSAVAPALNFSCNSVMTAYVDCTLLPVCCSNLAREQREDLFRRAPAHYVDAVEVACNRTHVAGTGVSYFN